MIRAHEEIERRPRACPRRRRGFPVPSSAATRSNRCWPPWDGGSVARQDEGAGGIREPGGHQDDVDVAAASARACRDVRQRGVAGRAAESSQHRRRVRLRSARGPLLHRDVVRAGVDPALRAPAHAGARPAAARRRRASHRQGRVRGAATRARARGRERHARAGAPGSEPGQHHHFQQRYGQVDRLRGGARHRPHTAQPAVRRALSLRSAERSVTRARTAAATCIRRASCCTSA